MTFQASKTPFLSSMTFQDVWKTYGQTELTCNSFIHSLLHQMAAQYKIHIKLNKSSTNLQHTKKPQSKSIQHINRSWCKGHTPRWSATNQLKVVVHLAFTCTTSHEAVEIVSSGSVGRSILCYARHVCTRRVACSTVTCTHNTSVLLDRALISLGLALSPPSTSCIFGLYGAM